MKFSTIPKGLALYFIIISFNVSLRTSLSSAGVHNKQTVNDTLYTLLKQQTDKFSDASDHGDTTVMGSLIDKDLLFSNGSGNVYTAGDLSHGGDDTVQDQADAISALLKKQTQAFINAGQRGDRVAMKRYLDSNVLFINADGVLAESKEFISGAVAPPLKGVSSTITVTGWALHHSGSLAVSCYIQDQVSNYGGKSLNEKFRTVETWVNHNGTWKLLGSETIPFHQDPQRVSLSPNELKEYPGVYIGATGVPVTVTLKEDSLSEISEGKSIQFKAELHDVFFTPREPSCYPRSRYIFQRDPGGRVTGFITRSAGGDLLSRKIDSVAQGGAAPAKQAPSSTLTIRDFVVHRSGDVAIATLFHDRVIRYADQVLKTTYRSSETWVKRGTAWKMITSQGRALQVDPPAITLTPAQLSDYTGTYAIGREFISTLASDANTLTLSINGTKAIPLDAEVHDVFFIPGLPRCRIIFQRDAHGHIIGYTRRSEGRDLDFTRRASI